MTKYPDRARAAVACVLFGGVSLVAACSGLTSTPPVNNTNATTPTTPPATASAPPTGTKPTSAPSAKPTATPTQHPTSAPTSTPTTAPQEACTVPQAPIPGTYTSMIIQANLNGSTLSLAANAPSLWSRESYIAATPQPTTSPTASPTIAPTTTPSPGPPLYAYFGTYTVTHNATTEPTGCAFLLTTQNGAPLMDTNVNSELNGTPNLRGPFTASLVATGSVTALSLTNLSATGGSGTFALSDGSTGTLVFSARISVTAAAVAKLHP